MRIELLTGLLRHRRAVVLGALATVTAAAWAYLLLGGGIETDDGYGRRADDGHDARVEPTVCVADLGYVVGDDGGYDAADCCADCALGHYARVGAPRQFQSRSDYDNAVCVGLSSRLVRVQPRRYPPAMGSRRSRTIIREDGVWQCDPVRHGTSRRRCLSMDAAEGCLP